MFESTWTEQWETLKQEVCLHIKSKDTQLIADF